MSSRQLDEEAIFHVARRIDDGEARSDYLNQVCSGDANLQSRVESLLEVHQQEKEFLKSSPEPAPTEDRPGMSEGPGCQIGRYKLLQQIGEGGFGVVYMAEQQRPVQRKVALKIIKPGMDTKAVVARFEAERQALALMDHPNIARVLDGGATDSGRPYFVMELIKGVLITEYCDQNQLSTHDRLKLFLTVCQAVQHAHQKGIIHRDLKPSNILVTLADGQPVIKVIDFGVAKAIHQRLTERTLFTTFGQMVGTPQYMSPEQAEMSCLDVDTRSDIYSLGVLLYELLTGTTPLEGERLRTAGYAEMQRIIREEEPPKPSTRLSSSSGELTTIAKHRRATPERLHKMVRGDLDWIVMKALDKDRARRYETASSLAADIERQLNDEPVVARPPSAAYRLSKFARRNKGPVAATIAIGVVLVIGIISTATTMFELRSTVYSLRGELTDRALNAAMSGDFAQAEDAIEKAEAAGSPDDLLQTLRGLALFYDGRTDDAIRRLEKAVEEDPRNLAAWSVLLWAYDYEARYSEQARVAERIAQLGLEPKTDYERLFELQANLYGPGSKRETIQRLTALIENHSRWGVAYALRAAALGEHGMETKELTHFDRAIEDAVIAEGMLPDNPFVLTISLELHIHAMQLAEARGQGAMESVTFWRSQAQELAARLCEWPDYLLGRELKATFYACTGQPDLAKQEEEELVRRGVGGTSTIAARLVEQNDLAGIKELKLRWEDDDSPEVQLNLAMILALESNDGRKRAMEIFRRVEEQGLSYAIRSVLLDIPFLAGELEGAEAASRRVLELEIPPSSYAWYEHRVKYLAGCEREQEFLERAGPFSPTRCIAHYSIAVKAIAQGDRAKARRHFTAACNTGKPAWWCYRWAKAFLAQTGKSSFWRNGTGRVGSRQSERTG